MFRRSVDASYIHSFVLPDQSRVLFSHWPRPVLRFSSFISLGEQHQLRMVGGGSMHVSDDRNIVRAARRNMLTRRCARNKANRHSCDFDAAFLVSVLYRPSVLFRPSVLLRMSARSSVSTRPAMSSVATPVRAAHMAQSPSNVRLILPVGRAHTPIGSSATPHSHSFSVISTVPLVLFLVFVRVPKDWSSRYLAPLGFGRLGCQRVRGTRTHDTQQRV
jgi:hypothetical protein